MNRFDSNLMVNTIIRAGRAVAKAVKEGRLVKPDRCESCGCARKITAAHYNYSELERVRWLCWSCHMRWDKEEPKTLGLVLKPYIRQSSKGEHRFNSKLTEANVREILTTQAYYGIQRIFSKKFGVSTSVISEVVSGKTWRHIMAERPRRRWNKQKPKPCQLCGKVHK